MDKPYYLAYEERYQAAFAAGIDYWGHDPGDTTLAEALDGWVKANRLSDRRVIEFACGEGAAGILLSRLGCRYLGVDIAPSAVEKTKQRLAGFPDAQVRLLDMVAQAAGDEYDAALDCSGLHMLVTDQDRRAYLQNAFHSLKPGAPMLFSFLTAEKKETPEPYDWGSHAENHRPRESVGGGFYNSLFHQFDDRHLGGVAAAGAGLDDPGIAAVPVGIFRRDFVEQLFGHALLGDKREDEALIGQGRILGNGDHFLGHGPDFLGTGDGGLDPAFLQQEGHHGSEHRQTGGRRPAELSGSGHMIHSFSIGWRPFVSGPPMPFSAGVGVIPLRRTG